MPRHKARLLRPLIAGLTVLSLLGVTLLAASDAHALRVTMKRVVFEGPVRTEVLTIINNTPDEQAYRLGWKSMIMTETQSLTAAEPGQEPAGFEEMKQMIRYAPRRIVLPPGASQQVRLMLRRPRDLADGEYRAHFWIQPEAESVRFDAPADPSPTGASVQIKMLTGLTLPVFVRQGNLSASARISDARLVRNPSGQNVVQYVLHREGSRSLYGDTEVICQSGGQEVVLNQTRGIAVYLDVARRQMATRVGEMPAGGCAAMSLRYRADAEDTAFRGQTLAEASVQM